MIHLIFSVGPLLSAQKATAPPVRGDARTRPAAVVWCSEYDNAGRGCLLQPWRDLLLCLSPSGDSFIVQRKHEEQYRIQKSSSPTLACSFPGLFPCLSQQRGPHTLWCWFFLPHICSFYLHPFCHMRHCLPSRLLQSGPDHPGSKACTQTCHFAGIFWTNPFPRGTEGVNVCLGPAADIMQGKLVHGARGRSEPHLQHHVCC